MQKPPDGGGHHTLSVDRFVHCCCWFRFEREACGKPPGLRFADFMTDAGAGLLADKNGVDKQMTWFQAVSFGDRHQTGVDVFKNDNFCLR
jgi:hypothetical protein